MQRGLCLCIIRKAEHLFSRMIRLIGLLCHVSGPEQSVSYFLVTECQVELWLQSEYEFCLQKCHEWIITKISLLIHQICQFP